MRDGLTPVLDAIREADGVILGSPNYLSEMNAAFRSLYERLVFQNLTYNKENYCCNAHMIPVLLIMTSNAPDTWYTELVKNYQETLSRLVEPTQTLICGDTLQLKDYSKLDWPWTVYMLMFLQKETDLGDMIYKLIWTQTQFAKNNADCVIFLRFINFIFLYAQIAV